MNGPFYICRVWFDRKQKRSRLTFITEGYGWGKDFSKAKTFSNRESAQAHLGKRSGSIFSDPEIRRGNYL
jgi:hypothetical protein